MYGGCHSGSSTPQSVFVRRRLLMLPWRGHSAVPGIVGTTAYTGRRLHQQSSPHNVSPCEGVCWRPSWVSRRPPRSGRRSRFAPTAVSEYLRHPWPIRTTNAVQQRDPMEQLPARAVAPPVGPRPADAANPQRTREPAAPAAVRVQPPAEALRVREHSGHAPQARRAVRPARCDRPAVHPSAVQGDAGPASALHAGARPVGTVRSAVRVHDRRVGMARVARAGAVVLLAPGARNAVAADGRRAVTAHGVVRDQ